MADLKTQLNDILARQKKIAQAREQLLREVGVEENRLQEAFKELSNLGIEAESLSLEELEELAEKIENDLAQKLQELSDDLAKGESLLREYQSA